MNDRMNDRDKLIKGYFKMGFTFSEIAQILSQTHRVFLSERTLKRATSKLGLFRRKNRSDIGPGKGWGEEGACPTRNSLKANTWNIYF
jgi:hypothetical protein